MTQVSHGIVRAVLACVVLLVLASGGWSSAGAQSGSAANGKSIYTNWCVGCHDANPKVDAKGVINGAGNPNFILNEWSIVPDMQFLLQGALPDPVQAAADVAAYLATFAGGGGQGQLQAPTSVDLGSQAVGTQSGAMTVTVNNVGGAGVTINSIADGDSTEFPIASQNCTTAPVAAGGKCKISLVFQPRVTGARSSTLAINSNGIGSPQTFVATGSGTNAGPAAGQLQVLPSLAFGAQNVGTQSAPEQVTLTNTGGATVTISTVGNTDPAEFPITASSCVGSIGPGAGCALTIAFNPTLAGARAASITIASTGVGSPQAIALSGTGAQTQGGAATVQAVEYYYATWDFYFETAFTDEITALDAGAFGAVWKRTGQTFNVWPQINASAAPTCRFFSTAFAPKSSHFYTPFSAECTTVEANAAWQYEAIAFYIQLADVNGLCAGGTIPLYRLYNNGIGGAPNHRYTTDLTIFNQMLSTGWLFEGNGNTKVFACVPQ